MGVYFGGINYKLPNFASVCCCVENNPSELGFNPVYSYMHVHIRPVLVLEVVTNVKPTWCHFVNRVQNYLLVHGLF